MIEEKDVTTTAISDVFRAAFMDVQATDENSFKVKGLQFPFQLNVRVEPEHKLISFIDFNRLNRIVESDALVLCNEANKNLGPARFFLIQQNGLLAVTHYQMTFERGVLPFHVVTSFRTFEYCAGSAVRGPFKDYILP